jgi:glutamine synthetase
MANGQACRPLELPLRRTPRAAGRAEGEAVTQAGGPLTIGELRSLVEAGQVDTVVIAITDMQGRLQGKRCSARYFLEVVVPEAAEGCNYLLAVDVDMNTVDGYAMSSWASGYGDFVLRPDLGTLRLMPWHEGTALVLCDLEWEDGSPVTASPRQVLLRQIERLAARGLVPYVGTELEFMLFKDGYEAAWDQGYRNLKPANQYNVDYSLLGTGRVEPLLRAIRNGMAGAGLYVESAKGECNLGQHEIAFRYAGALATCDNHGIYKTGAKEIAHAGGMSLTFMAKYDEREGNSCHIHISLRSPDGDPVLAGDRPHGFSPLMEHFLAGLLSAQRELTYFFAPNINSYKRYVPGSFAPTAIAWGEDNRTCAFRVVGHGHSLRVENRVPGGDVNPYLAVAALIAGGLHGIENELALEPAFTGNAYDSDKPRVPATLRDAADQLAQSKLALTAFGPEVVEHYLNAARVELAAYDAAVTDWERFRGFERL